MSKKFYITTSIPYTNAAPHIGFAFEIIQADVVARYQRSLGRDVYFLTGTDKHGLKTLRAAEAAGKKVLEFADEVSGKFRDLAEVLHISNDDFIRTTDEKRHLPAVYRLWEAFEKKGDIYKKRYKGFYCPGCEAFKTEKELQDGKCVIHQKPIEEIEEENYFFKLSKYLPNIKEAIESGELCIIPEGKKNEVLGMIEQGLDDVSFSRSKEKYWSWAVPGDESQVFYVWQDALPNYISAIGYADDEKKFNTYWPANVHCIGKDIIKFHAIYWPAMLMSADLAIPESLFVHGFINVDGQKMSKSLGNVVDPFELVKKYGVDAVRYYLLREITPTEDGDFTYEKFEARYNSDLAGGIGNLLARTITLSNKDNFILTKPQSVITEAIAKTQQGYQEALEEYRFNDALKSIWELITVCDKHINENKPWEGKENASQVVSDILVALNAISDLLAPFLPETSLKMKRVLETKTSEILFPRLQPQTKI
jgi:methionyl-tRNA synthetase